MTAGASRKSILKLLVDRLCLRPLVASVLALFAMLAYAPAGLAQRADNYDDCILQNMKGAGSSEAVSAIRQACRRKFPMSPAEVSAEVFWSGLDKDALNTRRMLSRLKLKGVRVASEPRVRVQGFPDPAPRKFLQFELDDELHAQPTSITLGVLDVKRTKVCTWDRADYSAFKNCDRNNMKSYDSQRSQGGAIFECNIENQEKLLAPVCVVGFGKFLRREEVDAYEKRLGFR